MDKKKILLPIAGFIGALIIALLITFPMLSMSPKDVPVGIVSLDKGITTPNGMVNAGDKFISNLINSDNELIDFRKVKSEKKLNKDLRDGRYYASIVVPKDFTKENGKSKIKIVINEGLNPMVTMNLSTVFNSMGSKAGINFDITSINKISSLGIKAMLLPMMFIMLVFVTSVVTGFLITNVKNDNKLKSYLVQVGYMTLMSFIIGFTIAFVALGISGVDIGIVKTALYLTMVSFALMLLVNGSINLIGRKGIVIPVLLFILGMGLVQMPYEYLNGVWQVLVASWEPFRYIGIGLREVMYQGKDVFNSATISLVIVAIIGIIFSIINIYKKEEA